MPTPSTFTAPPPRSPPPPPPRTLLLTVGSTSFTPLVTSLLSTSVLTTLSSLGIESVVAQIGNSDLPTPAKPGSTSADDEAWVVGSNRLVVQGRELQVEVLRFSNDLESKVGASDWVVAHAGAGSILSFIRPVPINTNTTPTPRPDSVHRKLFLIPNSTLMDSHQSDLADEFERYDWVEVIREPDIQEAEVWHRFSSDPFRLIIDSSLQSNRNLNNVFKEYLNLSAQTSKDASTTTTTKSTSSSTPIPPFDPFKIRTILDQVVGYV
ncbi:BZ3500_MvSof-1268-A1-R1_Chr9g10841 [Microbotryum saponariae]|uniref:UDP-N-acetylglucosamine transferase subunit ALG13 n=1 Tax=Microbotryum saponariae TaxID=289078 RepID=A0A2X0M8U6_9BASI|nr:BZ3501_MvSof-1269-A2-R1_Chr9g10589 [Microbotryum saponariae]SDA00789.1 BZ3500_MvSof-1268-A1-R1_Chr9g10841 [Microbotryum saponariae]